MTPKKTISPQRVLLVDDEPFVCEAINLALTRDGHNVKMVMDPDLAVALINTQEFDLLLTDYSMPKLTGMDLVKIAKHKDKDQRAIIMSGKADRLRSEGLIPRQIQLLTKPFSLDELRDAIGKEPTVCSI